MWFLGVCDYCKSEFYHVNKHTWRCKAHFDQSNHSNIIQNLINFVNLLKFNLISCVCGKQCKGLKGLKAHHQSCKTIKSLDKGIVILIPKRSMKIKFFDFAVCRETPLLKTGIKLPTNDKQWEMTNKYFRANINCG